MHPLLKKERKKTTLLSVQTGPTRWQTVWNYNKKQGFHCFTYYMYTQDSRRELAVCVVGEMDMFYLSHHLGSRDLGSRPETWKDSMQWHDARFCQADNAEHKNTCCHEHCMMQMLLCTCCALSGSLPKGQIPCRHEDTCYWTIWTLRHLLFQCHILPSEHSSLPSPLPSRLGRKKKKRTEEKKNWLLNRCTVIYFENKARNCFW